MNGSKLLLIGVLVGFGGGMTAAVGIKVMRGRGAGAGGAAVAEATATPEMTPMMGEPGMPPADASPSAEASPEASTVAAAGAPSGVATPYDMSPSSRMAAPVEDSFSAAPDPVSQPVAVRSSATSSSKGKPAGGTKVASISKSTARDQSDLLPVEDPPAKLVFAKPAAAGTALSRITEVRAGDNSTVRMELTGKARWKILELPKRQEVWVDFEEVEVPGGEKTASGSKVHVDNVRAKAFDGGAIARVIIKLAHEGKFSVSVSDGFIETASTKGKGRTGEADGMLEVSFIGAVSDAASASAAGDDEWAIP